MMQSLFLFLTPVMSLIMDPYVPLPLTTWECGGSPHDIPVIPLLTAITIVCSFNQSDWDNTTDFDYDWIGHYHTFQNETEITMDTFDTVDVTITEEETLYYQCQVAVYPAGEATSVHSNYSDPIELKFGEPCSNGGVGSLNGSGLYCDCSASFGYIGPMCDLIETEVLAATMDINNESNALASVDDIFVKADDFVEVRGNRMTSSSAVVVSILADKIESSASWAPETLTAVTGSIMGFVDTTFQTVKTTSRSGTSNEVYDKMEDSLFTLSAVILNSNATGDENGVQLSAGSITLNMNTLTSDRPSIQAEGANIEVSEAGQDKQALAITYRTSPYPDSINDLNGTVVNFRIQETDGTPINVTAQPVTLTFTPVVPENEAGYDNDNASSSYNISLAGIDPEMIFVVEANVSSGARLTFQARIDGIPEAEMADVNVKVTSGRVDETRNLLGVDFVTKLTESTMSVKMFGKNITAYGDYLVVYLRDDTGKTSEILLSAYGLIIFYWDTSHSVWIRSEQTNATGVSEDSGLVFTSNIFGSFSVSSFFIAPVPIDFEEIFGNFTDNLLNSPYVLTLVCLILAGLTIGIIFLRRRDRQDALLWCYLPLADNDPSHSWVYTVSVFTGISSPKEMSSTPFFILYGEYGNTGIRVLHDGMRKNFMSGTVSNFVMTSPSWLGDVVMVKMWTDGLGDHADWYLDRVVVVDRTTSSRYVFLCRDWFSVLKSDTLCHTLPPLEKETQSSSMSLVSRERLYDEHMWLSVAKRPTYSTFTRVQRLVVVISLLSLTMLTNAMFYGTAEDGSSDEKPLGLRLGPITISYKQIYVGVVSGFIVLVPSVFLAWVFTNRRRRHAHQDTETSSSTIDNTSVATHPTNSTSTISTSISDTAARGDTADDDDGPNLFLIGGKNENTIAPLATLIRDVTRVWHSGKGKSTIDLDIVSRNESFRENSLEKSDSVLTPVEVREPIQAPKKKSAKVFSSDGNTSTIPKKVDAFTASLIQECERSQPRPPQPQSRLPWWFVFVGYAVAGLLMTAGLMFTFLYSLQWGGAKSLDWMLSLVFSTSSSAFIFEPVKIIAMCIIVSYVFTRLVSSSLKDVAPYDDNNTGLGPLVDRPNTCPPPEVNTEFFIKRKKALNLQQRWHDILKSLGVRTGLVILFGIMCFHSDINVSFRENQVMAGLFNDSYAGRNLHSHSDVYTWLRDIVINQTMPMTHINGDPLSTEMHSFTNDLAHYRLGPIKVIQFRVQDKCSHDPADQSRYFRDIACWVDYSGDNEEDGNFGPKWTPCNASCPAPFSFSASSDHCLSVEGDVAIYGPSGYQVLLDSGQASAETTIASLESDAWLDHLTRGVLVEMMTFNPNTRLFSQVKVLLETASFGGMLQKTVARTARLYPYVSVWDYFVLMAQLIVVIAVVVRTAMLISHSVQSKGKCLLSSTVILTCFELLVCWCAICVFIARIHYTVIVLERIVNNRGEFTSFDLVFTLDFVYIACISTVLFLRMLLFLEPLKLNFYFYLMRETVRASMPQFVGYSLLLLVVLTAFASFFYVCRGSVTSNLKSMPRSYVSLMTVLLGHGKYRVVGGQYSEAGSPTGLNEIFFRVMYGFFCFAAAIWMVNIAVTILTFYMAEVTSYAMSKSAVKGGYDKRLNAYLWTQIDKLIHSVFSITSKHLPGVVKPSQETPTLNTDDYDKDDPKEIEEEAEEEEEEETVLATQDEDKDNFPYEADADIRPLEESPVASSSSLEDKDNVTNSSPVTDDSTQV